MTDPRLPVRAIDGARFSMVDVDTFERIAAGEPVFEIMPVGDVFIEHYDTPAPRGLR